MSDVIGWAWATSRALETQDGADDPFYGKVNGLWRTPEEAKADIEAILNENFREPEDPEVKLTWVKLDHDPEQEMCEFEHGQANPYSIEVFLVYPVRFVQS